MAAKYGTEVEGFIDNLLNLLGMEENTYMHNYDEFQLRDMFVFNLWSKAPVKEFWSTQWSLAALVQRLKKRYTLVRVSYSYAVFELNSLRGINKKMPVTSKQMWQSGWYCRPMAPILLDGYFETFNELQVRGMTYKNYVTQVNVSEADSLDVLHYTDDESTAPARVESEESWESWNARATDIQV